MKVGMLLDFAGTFRMTQEEEYEQIQKQFQDAVPRNVGITFKKDLYPQHWPNEKFDVFVCDFGGLLPGAEDFSRSIFRDLVGLIEERPNCLFFVWSSFSEHFYLEQMRAEWQIDRQPAHPNVRFIGGFDFDLADELANWFGWEKPEPEEHDVVLIDPGRSLDPFESE